MIEVVALERGHRAAHDPDAAGVRGADQRPVALDQLRGLFFSHLAKRRYEVVLLTRRHFQTAESLIRTHAVDSALRGAATDALERLGYAPRQDGKDIVLANCPFHRLAERHRPLICGMNLDLLDGLAEGLGADGRLVPRLEPTEGMCCVRLRGT